MDLTHRFSIPVSVEQAWRALNHLELIDQCFPGLTIDQVAGDEFTGSIKVKLGPIGLVYDGIGPIRRARLRRATAGARGPRGGPPRATAPPTPAWSPPPHRQRRGHRRRPEHRSDRHRQAGPVRRRGDRRRQRQADGPVRELRGRPPRRGVRRSPVAARGRRLRRAAEPAKRSRSRRGRRAEEARAEGPRRRGAGGHREARGDRGDRRAGRGRRRRSTVRSRPTVTESRGRTGRRAARTAGSPARSLPLHPAQRSLRTPTLGRSARPW